MESQSVVKMPDLDWAHAQIERLPVTMRPTLNEQLLRWPNLFPFEQRRAFHFMQGIEATGEARLALLTAPVRNLETRMGTARWHFDARRDTMLNASLLARQAEYPEWRRAVQKLFEEIDAAPLVANAATTENQPRLLLQILPAELPVDPVASWKQWSPRAIGLHVEGNVEALSQQLMAMIAVNARSEDEAASQWILDGAARPFSSQHPAKSSALAQLSFARLKSFREWFLAEANRVPKNIEQSDQTLSHLRASDWQRHWPAELDADERLKNFVVDLFLSGNGAMIFPGAFAQWAASEAQRRARPQRMAVRFGMRARPKPFTGVAIFENPQKISQLPDEDDPQGSAVDALILARYTWLALARYPESNVAYSVAISERAAELSLIPPPGITVPWANADKVEAAAFAHWLMDRCALRG